ncbi:PA3496 family putative envelope integrity protein [Spongorhabdus nitratireducens]
MINGDSREGLTMEQHTNTVDNYLESDTLISQDDVPQKGSKRSLHIRRAIEDHFENIRLSHLEDDNYWDTLA